MPTKFLVLLACAALLKSIEGLRVPSRLRVKVAAGLMSIGLGISPANADLFGPPAGLSDLKEKPQNYGRMADVGVLF